MAEQITFEKREIDLTCTQVLRITQDDKSIDILCQRKDDYRHNSHIAYFEDVQISWRTAKQSINAPTH